MVVLVYAYTGVLTSLLATPKLEPTVNTWEELAYGGKLRLTTEIEYKKYYFVTFYFLSNCYGT